MRASAVYRAATADGAAHVGERIAAAGWNLDSGPVSGLSLDPPMILKAGSYSPRSGPRFAFQEATLTKCSRQQLQLGR
jgi:hypothetical protein